ncbi:hypothetical protein ACTFIZ_008590 [Dictyostelium cf. discoideum]
MGISSDQEQLLSSTEDQQQQQQQQQQQPSQLSEQPSQLSEQPQHIIPIGAQNVSPMGKFKIPETFSCNIFTGYEKPTTCPTEILNYLSFDEYNSLVNSLNNKMETFHKKYWISFIFYIIVVLYCSFFIIYTDKIFLILGLLLTAIILTFFLNYLQKRNFENIKRICKEYTVQFSNKNIKVETTKKQFKSSVHIHYPQNIPFVLSQQYLQPQFQPIFRQNIINHNNNNNK